MLATGAGGGVGDVVSRRKRPFPFFAEEAEVLGVIIPVLADYVEHHPAEHLLHLCSILGQVTREGKQVHVVDILAAKVRLEQSCCRQCVDALAVPDVKPLDCKVPVIEQSDIRHDNAALLRGIHIEILHLANVRRVVSVPELDQPIGTVPGFEYCLGTGSA